jgi:hypothetical protein
LRAQNDATLIENSILVGLVPFLSTDLFVFLSLNLCNGLNYGIRETQVGYDYTVAARVVQLW